MPRLTPKKIPLMDEFYDEFEFEIEIILACRTAREKQSLSQYDLANKIGIHQTALARFETGKSVNPTLSFLKKVLLGLGLRITISKKEDQNKFVI